MSTKSAKLRPGDRFTVRSGEFKGHTATIVDAKPFPDSDLERRRKITVEVDGDTVYMLPRMLETGGSNATVTRLPVAATPQYGETVLPAPEGDGFIVVPGDITDVDDPRLDPWRPFGGDPVKCKAFIESYISRKMPNGQVDTDFLLSFYAKRQNVMLSGDTQSGKTMLVQVLAILAGAMRESGKPLPVFTLSGSSGVTDFDLFGQPTAYITPDGRERLVNLPGLVDLAAKAGGILYLDELNFMGERTQSSLHPICDHRHSFVNRQKAVRTEHDGVEVFMPEVVEASPELWIVSTINPGYKSTSLGEAMTNRFRFIPWGYDDSVEAKLIPSAAVRLLGQALREARNSKNLRSPVGTAALSRMCDDAIEYGPETAVWMLREQFERVEQPKIDAIVTDRSIMMMLQDEAAARQNEGFDAAAITPDPLAGNPLLGGA